MQILCPGKTDRGFATLDALIAVLILSIALAGLAFWVLGLARVSERRQVVLDQLLSRVSHSESVEWVFEEQPSE